MYAQILSFFGLSGVHLLSHADIYSLYRDTLIFKMHFWIVFVCVTRISLNRGSVPGGGGRSTSLLEASRDVSLDGVAFSQLLDYNGVAFSIELLEWCRTSLDF